LPGPWPQLGDLVGHGRIVWEERAAGHEAGVVALVDRGQPQRRIDRVIDELVVGARQLIGGGLERAQAAVEAGDADLAQLVDRLPVPGLGADLGAHRGPARGVGVEVSDDALVGVRRVRLVRAGEGDADLLAHRRIPHPLEVAGAGRVHGAVQLARQGRPDLPVGRGYGHGPCRPERRGPG